MKTRLSYWKEILESTFWFTPAVTAVSLLILLIPANALENHIPRNLPFWQSNTIEGTRLVLSSIATAVMTVVGVLFSVTIVVLQQVSQQYTPRVIENFIRSISNQFVLGFYIGTFGYSLLLLRSLPEKGGGEAPILAPLVAITLATVCLALLIYFVHHLSKSIKSNTILTGISRQAVAALRGLQKDISEEGCRGIAPIGVAAVPFEQKLCSKTSGYLQGVNWHRLEAILSDLKWDGELCVTPGDYLHEGAHLIQIRSSRPIDAECHSKIVDLFKINLVRTHSQDVRFGVRQMVDMALRALSPGINDPTTAIEALNEIGTVLLYYTQHCEFSNPVIFQDGSCLRLQEPSYKEFVNLCFNQIAFAGKSHYLVQERIYEILQHCIKASTPERAHILSLKDEQLKSELGAVPGSTLYS